MTMLSQRSVFVLAGAAIALVCITAMSISFRDLPTCSCDREKEPEQQNPPSWGLAKVCSKPAVESTQATPVIVEMKGPSISAKQVARMNETQLAEFCGGYHHCHTGWNPTRPIEFCIHNPAPDCCVSRKIAMNSFWEMDMMRRFDSWMAQNAKEPGIVLDVGSNVGQYGIVAALRGHRVFMWEAFPMTAEIVHRTVLLNQLESRVTVFNNAISDFRGVLDMKMPERNTGEAGLVVPKKGQQWEKRGTVIQQANVATIDDFVDAILEKSQPGMKLHAMKIDVEGQELHFFANASRLFSKLRPQLILMEITPERYRDCSLIDFVWFLVSHGYQVELVRAAYIDAKVDCPGNAFAPMKSRDYVRSWLATQSEFQYDIFAELT